jgi:L-iditol 2-dehydrogenase
MKAAVYYGPGDIRVEDCPEPEPTSDNLIAEVHYCAICGSDKKLATIGHPRWRPPRIIGHEMVGHLVHIGSDVSGYSLGERITLATTLGCLECDLCRLGLTNLCPNAQAISQASDGAFAERIAIPPLAIRGGNVLKVPDGVSDESAALSEPLSCAINAQELAGVKAGDRVLIIGGGPLGALHAELAKALGAADVMISQRSEPRLSLLRRLRDVVVIDGAHEDVAAVVDKRTAGLGADVVIVAGPTHEAHEMSIDLARKGGAISLFSSLPKEDPDVTFNSRVIHYGELRIVGSSDSRPEHVAKGLRLMAEGRIDSDALITHQAPLDALHAGLQLMIRKQSLKVLVDPRQEVGRTGVGAGHCSETLRPRRRFNDVNCDRVATGQAQ